MAGVSSRPEVGVGRTMTPTASAILLLVLSIGARQNLRNDDNIVITAGDVQGYYPLSVVDDCIWDLIECAGYAEGKTADDRERAWVLESTQKEINKALQEANPDWSVRRAFTAQIIINHVEARDDEVIDNMQQALDRAVENGVKNLVVQPTHLMHGAEYDEMTEAINGYKDKFESVAIAEPMLGEVGDDATVINDDKKAVAQAITDEACKEAGFDDMKAAADAGTAFVFMGHGTSHTANVTYDQMQTQMDDLGFTNAFIGTVEGEPEDTACDKVIEKVKEAGFKNVILRPLMVVAGDHANNDMAGDDADSWKSQFEASGDFDSVDCQIAGLGRIAAVEDLYVAHTKAAIDSLGASDDAAAEDTDAKATDDSADDAQADDAAETTADTAEADAE